MNILVKKKLVSLFIVLTCFICFHVTPSHSKICSYNWNVAIYNGIPDSTIGLHVKSKDDDLGEHYIAYGEHFYFHFCENIFRRTVFAGDFSHGPQFAHFNVFDDEVAGVIGRSKDSHVYWLLKGDGYYLSKELKPVDDPSWIKRGNW
ncbi:hypothetical protein QVD17_33909 [Tagetes erecta]|uniref:S-protein homolog n=1 Tax=Tagetes erecta TaxID=13708 RepID=A0AAD8K3P3_TARER|nr:hypothetical protein QVD17_33909 [Tagetes erecta]